MAQQLQTVMSDAQAKGTPMQMTLPFETGCDTREPKFHAAPQPPMPPKNYQDMSRVGENNVLRDFDR